MITAMMKLKGVVKTKAARHNPPFHPAAEWGSMGPAHKSESRRRLPIIGTFPRTFEGCGRLGNREQFSRLPDEGFSVA